MTSLSRPRFQISLFLFAVAGLTYLWWGTVEHLLNLILYVDAFSHGQLIPFISMWLVWNKREEIRLTETFIWIPAIALLVGAVLLWFVGEVVELKLLGHIAYVTGVQSFILIFFGPQLYQRLLFPCLFLYLAIPVGHGLIPIMQDVTAQMSVGLLWLVGIPYELDGILITLPSGVYEVARACAGVRFLFTSIVTGFLLAYLVYSQWKKRILIVVVAAIIPIFANVLRVFGIFLISEATDQSFARDVDHLIYGWGFLTAILLTLIAVAYRFADHGSNENQAEPLLVGAEASGPIAVISALPLVFLLPFSAVLLAPKQSIEDIVAAEKDAPECINCDVRRLSRVNVYDKAQFSGADAEIYASYRIAADQVTVSSALYCPQRRGSRLIQTGNAPRGRGWLEFDGKVSAALQVAGVDFQETVYTQGNRQRLVWVSYFMDREWLPTAEQVKWKTVEERLFKGGSAGAVLVVSARAYGKLSQTRGVLKKLLSTFPPDSFLWEEINPKLKGTTVCVE